MTPSIRKRTPMPPKLRKLLLLAAIWWFLLGNVVMSTFVVYITFLAIHR
jgi:hypothetical protein